MNIRYNSGNFEAEFSTDFQGDLAAVKAAGFRTSGPPQWIWYTNKLSVLNKLRENKPASGLSITEDAYSSYLQLSEIEAKNAEVRAKFAPIKAEQDKAKKERKKKEIKEQNYVTVVIPPKPGQDFDYIGAEDLPSRPPYKHKFTPDVHTGPFCMSCSDPVYFYELQNPPVCLWCEVNGKIVLDKQPSL